MEIAAIILITLLLGSWFIMNDVWFSFCDGLRMGVIKYRTLAFSLIITFTIGFLIFRNPAWDIIKADLNIKSPIISITIASATFLSLLIFKRWNIFNSVCYSLMGAIWGWMLFNNNCFNEFYFIPTISSWIISPIIACALASMIYMAINSLIVNQNIHLLKLSSYMRIGIIIGIILTGIAIGMNNIPLLMLVTDSGNLSFGFDFSLFSMNNHFLVWFISVISMLILLLTPFYRRILNGSREVINTNMLVLLSVLLTQFIVLSLFSSSFILSLFGLKAVAISPIYVGLGALVGIGFTRKLPFFENKSLYKIVVAFVGVPIISFGISYLLFNILNVQEIIHFSTSSSVGLSGKMFDLTIPLIVAILTVFLIFVVFSFRHQQVKRIQAQNALKEEQQRQFESRQVMTSMELKTIQLENEQLSNKMEIRRKELIDLALNISEQRNFLELISQQIKQAQQSNNLEIAKEELEKIIQSINSKMNFTNEMSGFYSQVEELHKNFISKLLEYFPDITEQEKRLATLLRLGFSTKEIAGLMNISAKSVEIGRYRLRKKMGLSREDNLMQYIKSL